MVFTCKICQKEICIAEPDKSTYERRGWECDHCYSVIFKKRYPVNLAGTTTVFTPTGYKLGDQVFAQIIRDEYRKDNPDETVIFLEGALGDLNDIYQHSPTKIFWSNLFAGELFSRPENAYWFSLTTETEYYARNGQFARLWFEPEPVFETELSGRYVVCHFRNLQGEFACEHKNVGIDYALLILAALRDLSGRFDRVVLIGNDPVDFSLSPDGLNFVLNANIDFLDLRNRLSLPQLAFVLGNAFLFIGADSGPVHLAAAAGCRKIISWNYMTEHWFPRAPEERLVLWHKKNSTVEAVVAVIVNELK